MIWNEDTISVATWHFAVLLSYQGAGTDIKWVSLCEVYIGLDALAQYRASPMVLICMIRRNRQAAARCSATIGTACVTLASHLLFSAVYQNTHIKLIRHCDKLPSWPVDAPVVGIELKDHRLVTYSGIGYILLFSPSLTHNTYEAHWMSLRFLIFHDSPTGSAITI